MCNFGVNFSIFILTKGLYTKNIQITQVSIMSSKSQRKGRQAELELTKLLIENGLPAKAGQPLNFGCMPDITGLKGVHIEVKRHEHLNLSSAMQQAIEDAEKFNDGAPAVFHRKSRSPWLVTMLLDDWLVLYKGNQHE